MEWNGEEMKICEGWTESNGVYVKERKKGVKYVMFSKWPSDQTSLLCHSSCSLMAIGSKTKCQDKTLAIGSNQNKPTWDKTQHLLETLTRSVLARRDKRKSQKHKTYGKDV